MNARTIATAMSAALLATSCAPPRNAPPDVPQRMPPIAVSDTSPAYTAGGEVLGVERATPDDPATHVHLVIQPTGRSPIRVDLGPGWYLDEHGLSFSARDVVEVEGRTETRDNGDVLVARKIRKDGRTVELGSR